MEEDAVDATSTPTTLDLKTNRQEEICRITTVNRM